MIHGSDILHEVLGHVPEPGESYTLTYYEYRGLDGALVEVSRRITAPEPEESLSASEADFVCRYLEVLAQLRYEQRVRDATRESELHKEYVPDWAEPLDGE